MEETDLINQKDFPRLKERIGHHKSEVAVGLIYGAVLTWLFILWLS
jgi:acid phosphatase family membrane protein YuiD